MPQMFIRFPRITMVLLMSIVGFLAMLGETASIASACGDGPTRSASGPWPDNTIAIIRGKAVSVSEDRRQAELQISAYVGPERDAPAVVSLPATDNGSPRHSKCADPSNRFTVGQEYVVFLSSLPPNLKLTSSAGTTAHWVTEDGLLHGLKLTPEHLLQDFAEKRGFKAITATDPKVRWSPFPYLWVSVITILLVGAALAAVLYRRKQKAVSKP
jgi:hypothetical protein